MHEAISLLLNARIRCIMPSRRKYGGKGLSPGKFRGSPGQYYVFWLLALFTSINVGNKIILLTSYI